MNDISPAAKAAQNAARRANGEFGNQYHSEPEEWGEDAQAARDERRERQLRLAAGFAEDEQRARTQRRAVEWQMLADDLDELHPGAHTVSIRHLTADERRRAEEYGEPTIGGRLWRVRDRNGNLLRDFDINPEPDGYEFLGEAASHISIGTEADALGSRQGEGPLPLSYPEDPGDHQEEDEFPIPLRGDAAPFGRAPEE